LLAFSFRPGAPAAQRGDFLGKNSAETWGFHRCRTLLHDSPQARAYRGLSIVSPSNFPPQSLTSCPIACSTLGPIPWAEVPGIAAR